MIRPARVFESQREPRPPEPQRGRGALTNRSGRFEPQQRQTIEDGWSEPAPTGPFKTEVTLERAKSVITRNKSPDIAFDRSINPFRGCEHGCVYCFARPNSRLYGVVARP